jgi:hypothetical protein
MKNPSTRKALAKKFGSRKCHFAMTQAFLGQPIAPAHSKWYESMKAVNPSSIGVRGAVGPEMRKL